MITRFPKSVFERPKCYPLRNHGNRIKKWLIQDEPDENYKPVEFLSENIKDKNEPKSGRPLNPKYRTGITNRGVLHKWGPNFAADALVTRKKDGGYEMLVIKRKNGEWAIPGGFIDDGEDPVSASLRELKEETGMDLDRLDSFSILYKGYVDDPRTTDNAWIETTVVHINLSSQEKYRLHAGDDADDVKWISMTNENMNHLYANHCDFAKEALIHLNELKH